MQDNPYNDFVENLMPNFDTADFIELVDYEIKDNQVIATLTAKKLSDYFTPMFMNSNHFGDYFYLKSCTEMNKRDAFVYENYAYTFIGGMDSAAGHYDFTSTVNIENGDEHQAMEKAYNNIVNDVYNYFFKVIGENIKILFKMISWLCRCQEDIMDKGYIHKSNEHALSDLEVFKLCNTLLSGRIDDSD